MSIPNNIPPLKSDFMTKLKQIIVAIPNSELIMKGKYKEVFETQCFEEFLLKMVAAAREFMASTAIDKETKFNLFFSYHYYVDLLCESMADKSISFSQMNLLAQMKQPFLELAMSTLASNQPQSPNATVSNNVNGNTNVINQNNLTNSNNVNNQSQQSKDDDTLSEQFASVNTVNQSVINHNSINQNEMKEDENSPENNVIEIDQQDILKQVLLQK